MRREGATRVPVMTRERIARECTSLRMGVSYRAGFEWLGDRADLRAPDANRPRTRFPTDRSACSRGAAGHRKVDRREMVHAQHDGDGAVVTLRGLTER